MWPKNTQHFPYPRKQLISEIRSSLKSMRKNIKIPIVKKEKSKLFRRKTVTKQTKCPTSITVMEIQFSNTG